MQLPSTSLLFLAFSFPNLWQKVEGEVEVQMGLSQTSHNYDEEYDPGKNEETLAGLDMIIVDLEVRTARCMPTYFFR